MIDLEAIRARDAATSGLWFRESIDPTMAESHAAKDRRALLAYVDALREAAGKALRLTEYADMSDECQYGTLDTTLVRDLLADLRRLLGESHE